MSLRPFGIFSVVLALLAGVNLREAEVNMVAAASLTESLKEAAAGFEKQSGDKIIFNFGASSILARQIEEGAPADIFFSADEAKMDSLERKDLIIKSTRKNRLSNSLVIVVSAEGGAVIHNPEDLATSRVKRLALAEPRTVPAGIYARQYLESRNLWSSVQAKVIPTENVRSAVAAVESGNVDAGIVYKTDAAISRKVKVAFEIPPSEGPNIRYPIAVLKEAKNKDAALKLMTYLNSPEAARVFEKYGFIVLE